ncbi:Serine/threonine-specific protein phosphatase/bis(5-nucleosyl)-tetraphosphatase [Phaffia rhodozyma]|uniref:Serine/threonine-specific protein phosphatase/bis(5-nucleosyl)-tetraphosphatase n=1 Tax=Phaffia rhodozyma TaxID=264483 RepID=A0A0F7SFW5_PHARH|nr:Serine/threonine-specific protein phosphatase/bis(5-nucleosyl)-tetraphosphatase [Phaffia rhodozyma]
MSPPSPARELPLHRRSSSASAALPKVQPSLHLEPSSTWDEIFPPPTADRQGWAHYRRPLSFGVVGLFLFSVSVIALLGVGGPNSRSDDRRMGSGGGTIIHGGNGADVSNPDYSQYVSLQTIPSSALPLDKPGHRLIIIGDIHGSIKPLKKLLKKVDYEHDEDTFLHVGDLVGKGPKPLEVLELLRKYKVRGVRGNHDQPVIEIRSWMEHTFKNRKTGKVDFSSITLAKAKKLGFPEAWAKWENEHFETAKTMSKEDYAYLLSLPLKLHLPSVHTFIAHAGLLPVSTASTPADSNSKPKWKSPSLPRLQAELSLLSDVEPNTDPWVLLNMRSILANGTLTKSSKMGEPWSDLWNDEMKDCRDGRCWPSNVVYGHAASRGLDVKTYSFGLDSGCVYGKQLTALVLGSDLDSKSSPKAVRKGTDVMVGEFKGKLVQVECKDLD